MEEMLETIRTALEDDGYEVIDVTSHGDPFHFLVSRPGDGVQYTITIHDPT